MKKLLALCLTAVLCLILLASCGSSHKENEWFSEEKLTKCLVGDLPTVTNDYVKHSDQQIYVKFTDDEFEAYAKTVYDYLSSQNYKYLGTRGEMKNTLAGLGTSYYFEPATVLSEFYVDGAYRFVYSDGTLDENGNPIFCILRIYDCEVSTLEHGKKSFTYNTVISLCYKSESALAGVYVLKDVADGNHFIRNQAGAEWLGEITAEDIAEIKMISGGGGPLPPVSKTHISSSINDAVISSIFEEYYWLDSTPVSEERTQIADGGYFIVQFILNNGETKQLYFINGDFYHDGNGNYFEIVRLPVFRDGTDFVTRYGFERQYNPYQIHLIDGTPVCEIPFSEFEFTELTDDIYLDAELPTHYFELRGERVYFIKGEYFYIGDNRSAYYHLIGNLDELIAEYSDEKCNHEWDNGVEIEGGNGGYVMEYTCTLCGDKKRETITIPPENHFLRNQAGCEWLNEITAEDIAEIKIISGAVGVAPGYLNNVSSSTDEAVIARIFEEYYWLDTIPISQMEGQIYGGGGVTVKFILKDGTAKELYINNGNYRDPDGNYFELLFTPKFKDTDNALKAHGFITYLGTGTVYDKDNNAVCEIPIDELEFVESDGCVDAVVTGYYYTVETEFGTLYFDYSNDLFYLQFEEGEVDYIEFYRLVGKNLDELIAEYSTTE